MPNNPKWKYPCIECAKPVKSNQKGIECSTCTKWVHLKCTNLTQAQYDYLEANENIPFHCLICNPRLLYADGLCANNTPPTTSPTDIDNTLISSLDTSSSPFSLNDSNSSFDFSSANSSDFVYVDETDSDSELRGLNFESLPNAKETQYLAKY